MHPESQQNSGDHNNTQKDEYITNTMFFRDVTAQRCGKGTDPESDSDIHPVTLSPAFQGAVGCQQCVAYRLTGKDKYGKYERRYHK